MFVHQKSKIMKKITLLIVFLVSLTGFSQNKQQKLQAYFDSNYSKSGLTKQDVSDWVIASENYSDVTKISNVHVTQRYQGIEIFNATSSAWVKDGQIINYTNNFKSNIAGKANAVTPRLSAIQAVQSAYAKLKIVGLPVFAVAETINAKEFKLTDGLQEDQISVKLVYQTTENNQLVLAWALQFYAPGSSELWDLRVDALKGDILEKNDLTVRCSFGELRHTGKHNHKHANESFSFTKNAFSNSEASMLEAQGGSYRVIRYDGESPSHSPFQLISNPENALASPNGWHDVNTTIGGVNPNLKYTFSRGNNALVQEDADGVNTSPGDRAEGGATLNFDFPYLGPWQQPTAYTNASITNMFYMVNIMHDVWYQYGFTEANGNFQQTNYGRGGTNSATGDAVQADSQDGYSQTTPTLNNANFATPNDGGRPRAQMYLWDAGAPPTNYITVYSPAAIEGQYTATSNVFATSDRIPVPTAPAGITSELVLYTNAPNATGNNPITVNNACVVPTNALDISGKIALIRRGNCNFSNKVKNAQDAGALAVIVFDTVVNNPVRLSMSSEDVLGITIPAVFVTAEIGQSFVNQLANGPVNLKLESPSDLYLYADGDFDNTIIAHEVGHGISNRLIGPINNSSCMINVDQMGEGWSDWFGLMMQMKTGDTKNDPVMVGTFVYNQPNDGQGLRQYPYSWDMSVNPRTFISASGPVDSNGAYRYEIGETWATILWDLSWAYVERYGFDSNIYTGTGGNNKVMQLVIDALKLQACNTATMVTARDNIFAADQAATGGENYNMIAEVFRRRGLGLGASSASTSTNIVYTQSFEAFPLATTNFTKENTFKVYPNPSNSIVNVRLNQFVGKVNIQVVDINGRVVFTTNEDNFNVEKAINLSSLQKGMYVLKVNTTDFNFTEKIILK